MMNEDSHGRLILAIHWKNAGGEKLSGILTEDYNKNLFLDMVALRNRQYKAFKLN